MARALLAVVAVVAVLACGHVPVQRGVITNEAGIIKTAAGPADPDVTKRGLLPGTLTRAKHADVLGDDRPELLVEGPREKNLEIRDEAGQVVRTVRTTDYLTDFGAITAGEPPKKLLVLYTYPNSTRGGTFEVLENGDRPVASWDETPPPSHFCAGRWQNRPALFYLRDDDLIVRTETGALLATLKAPQGHIFRSVEVQTLRDGTLALVASGSGYTRYHMVCMYRGDRLVYQDVDDDNAYAAEPADSASAVVVATRTTRWKYALPPR